MDIDLVPVNESVPEAKAPEPLPNDLNQKVIQNDQKSVKGSTLQEKVLNGILKVEEKTLVDEALPKKRGRGRLPGAKNKEKVKTPKVEESLPVVEEALPLATPRGNPSSSSSSSVTYEQTRESLLPPKPMTPLELSRHLRELSSARQQEKRSYYGKMLAHLM